MMKGKEIATGGLTSKVDHFDEAAKDNSPTTIQAEEISRPTVDHDDRKKFSVLIVDGCLTVQVLHRVWATKLGLNAYVAENGKIAVDLHRSGASFDLILMDLALPVMNGEQATKELRAMGVDTMIVGVTAYDDGPERQAFVEAGLNACYSKPFTEFELAPLVQVVKDNKEKSK